MRKIISHALVAGVIVFGVTAQVSAGPLAPIVNHANHLRATSDSLNYHASQIENTIRQYQAHGEDARYLKHKAQQLRKKAKRLALKSNRVAKEAFDLGYHRSNHSHHTGYPSHYYSHSGNYSPEH